MNSITPYFRKSSYSTSNNCVECATSSHVVAVRDSQNRYLGHLPVPVAEWRAFLAVVKNDDL